MTKTLIDGRGGRFPGGGRFGYMEDLAWLRGTAVDLAGFTPWVRGGGVSRYGVPLGPIKDGVGILQCDPISWFERARLISSPSAYILGLNGLGKSSLIRRWILAMAGYGVPSLVLADLKGEHVDAIKAIGGQEIQLGRGLGRLNVLDLTEAFEAVKHLPAAQSNHLLATARARRQAMVESLFAIDWGHTPSSRECSILAAAIEVMDERIKGEADFDDLLAVVKSAPDAVQEVAVNRGDMAEYQRITAELESTLVNWCKGRGLGEVFAGKTTARLIRGKSAVINISNIDEEDLRLRAAAMVASWGVGFGQIAISHAYAAAGLETYQPIMIHQDEMWQAIALPGVAARYNSLTRLDRRKGVGRVMCSHSAGDPRMLTNQADRAMAEDFLAKSGIVMMFGLPESEMAHLEKTLRITNAEADYLTGLTTPAGYDSDGSEGHPGRGKALCKAGANLPGIPFELVLTAAEKTGINNTNQLWKMR